MALALQEVIGAAAGWFNILSGGIFRVGDRVQLGGVNGDVIDITPLRTKLMEIGSELGEGDWVRGRQHTGRIVAVSNRASLTAPVYNYSGVFEYMWEEMTLPIAFRDDWREAERILFEEIRDVSTESGARAAMLEMGVGSRSRPRSSSRASSSGSPTTTCSSQAGSSCPCARPEASRIR